MKISYDRSNNSPPKSGNGAACTEPVVETRECNKQSCPECAVVQEDGTGLYYYPEYQTINETDCSIWYVFYCIGIFAYDFHGKNYVLNCR